MRHVAFFSSPLKFHCPMYPFAWFLGFVMLSKPSISLCGCHHQFFDMGTISLTHCDFESKTYCSPALAARVSENN